MTRPTDVWHSEHARFAHLLHFLEQQLLAYRNGDDPDYALMRDVVHYLHHYADACHHPREDVAFERLVRHDPSLAMPIQRLLQEHRVLAAAGGKLLALLEDVLEDVVHPREDLEAAAATYVIFYLHHLAEEEREIVPRAERLLTPDDWAAVAAAVAATPDPLAGPQAGELYRDLRRQISIQEKT
jgi:hemerythrin-like domain-containing protein